MRNLKVNLPSPNKTYSENRPKITFAFNAQLVQEISEWLKSCQAQGFLIEFNQSRLVNEALKSYQDKTIKIDFNHQFSTNQKVNVCYRFPQSLLNFYYTLPHGKRTQILQLSLWAYYQKKKQELIDKGQVDLVANPTKNNRKTKSY